MSKEMNKPDWIRGKVSWSADFGKVRDLLQGLSLNSVCVSAACPNKGECWSARHVTFMILGDQCTRACLFCNVNKGKLEAPNPKEAGNVSKAVKELGLKYVVVTSVTRDDLPDKGTDQFVRTVREIKKDFPASIVELLIPDMDARGELLEKIAFSGADVIGHNIEMPEVLYRKVRPGSNYQRSLQTLSTLKRDVNDIPIKSSVILGLGEKRSDILLTLQDLKGAGVDIIYIGQYLSPSRDHWPVKKYYTPAEFRSLEKKAKEMGFRAVLSGPMIRSSYRAHESYLSCKNEHISRENLDNTHI
jgi:lipoic acid synthetase